MTQPSELAVEPVRGLTSAEVRQRVQAGLANGAVSRPSRALGDILRANLFTRFNALLGALLVLILLVGPIQDALFGIVLVANSAVGIVQELRAKRTLDRLSLLDTPTATVVRDGETRKIAADEVVLDDVLALGPGDQLVVDGEVLDTDGLELDESLLTGEADPVSKRRGDQVLSGSFVVAGTGRARAARVGEEAYAVVLAAEARRFTLVHSEIRDALNRVLQVITWALVPAGVLLFTTQLLLEQATLGEAVRGSVAGVVGMVPEGLVLLTSVAFAVGVVRLGARGVLVEELPAIEGLARVDVVAIDKTGTLTEGSMTVGSLVPLAGCTEAGAAEALGALAHADERPNASLRALAEEFAAPVAWQATERVPFSSTRKWSGVTFDLHGTWVLGAPEVLLQPGTPVLEKAERLAAGLSPHQKRGMVRSLQERGHVVAMAGDGVNDVLALKDADIGIAMGGGAQAARGVAQLVLLRSRFDVLPHVVAEGRRIIGNIERVANLFLTKTVYVTVLALAVGVAQLPFPFYPRHLTVVSTLTIGVPAFFLALAPNQRRARPHFLRRVLRFTVPAGLVAASATFAAYAVTSLETDLGVPASRTAATVVLFGVGMTVLALLAYPLSRLEILLLAALVATFAVLMAVPEAREFFALSTLPLLVWASAGLLVAVAGAALVAVWWFALRPDDVEPYARERFRPLAR